MLRQRSRFTLCLTLFLTAWLPLLLSTVSAEEAGSVLESLSGENQRDFELYRQILTGQAYPLDLRRTAAIRLLERGWPQGINEMLSILADNENQRGRLAVAQALAEALPKLDAKPQGFIEPLIVALSAGDENIRQAAALALANYQHHVLPQLRRIILEPEPSTSEATRLAAVAAVERIKDKRSAKILIDTLQDSNSQLSARCRQGLEHLTGIRFGDNNTAWQQWWQQYKGKELAEWLELYIAAMDNQNRQLQKDLELFRATLHTQIQARYQAAQDKTRLLQELLDAPLADVRLQGLYLAKSLLGGAFPQPLQDKIRRMTIDSAPAVRVVCAQLLRDLRDKQAANILLEQLADETDPKVRASFADALGYLAGPAAVEPLIMLLGDPDPLVVADAASALANLSRNDDVKPLKPSIVQALLQQYQGTIANNGADAALRSEILSAMVQIGSPSFRAVFIQALKDDSALSRAAAVEGLRNLPLDNGRKEVLASLTPLLADPDHGVRLEVLRTIDDLAGPEELQNLEKRLDPETEPDADVREEVWRVFLNLLARADLETIEHHQHTTAAEENVGRQEQILKILEEKLAQTQPASPRIIEVREALGDCLVSLKRSEAAAAKYRLAYDQAVERSDSNAPALTGRLALKLLDTLLSQSAFAQAAELLKELAYSPPTQQEALDKTITFLQVLLNQAADSQQFSLPLELIAALENAQIPALAQPPLEARLDQLKTQALDGQYRSDRQIILLNVDKLVQDPKDLQALTESRSAVNKLGLTRAGKHLLEELDRLLSSTNPDPVREKTLVDLLTGLDPAFADYDLGLHLDHRRAVLARWQGFLQATTTKQ